MLDPIVDLKIDFEFYNMTDRLHIDIEHLCKCLKNEHVRLLVLIHFFGYVDPNYEMVIQLARRNGCLVLEDEAHAMLTDLVGGATGRRGDAAIFSFHKLLPVNKGGALVLNAPSEDQLAGTQSSVNDPCPFEFDLKMISEIRRRNATVLDSLLTPLREELEPLWGLPTGNEVLQSYPLLVRNASRDDLYFSMNKAGFGVISLYHTLVPQIASDQFPEPHSISRKILNLPIHQDVSEGCIESMISQLKVLLS